MVQSLIESIADTLYDFPSTNSIFDIMSASTIVEGKPKIDISKDMIASVHTPWYIYNLAMI